MSRRDCDAKFREYLDTFVRDFSGPYGIQFPGRSWRTVHTSLPDRVVKGHLDRKYWVGTRAAWYPQFAYIDVDHPDERGREDLADRVIQRLGINRSQYLACTSPSWPKSGNLHLILAPRWEGQPPTKRRLSQMLGWALRDLAVELYPQESKRFRLPFGLGQYILDPDTEFCVPMEHLGWQEAMDAAKRIDDLPLEDLPVQTELVVPYRGPGIQGLAATQAAENLLLNGLQAPSSRHKVCLQLAIYMYRLNQDPRTVAKTLKNWIREKHNGLSREVNRGNWRLVDKEIDDIVSWVYERYNGARIWPDNTHNAEGWVTADDVRMIVEMFRGDIVNMKRLFPLMLYYRPRQCHDWTFMPRRLWVDVASERTYKGFQRDIAQKGLLELPERGSYRVGGYLGGYPKRFRLHVREAPPGAMLENDGRAIQTFREACMEIYNSKQAIKEALGLNKTTAWRFLERPK